MKVKYIDDDDAIWTFGYPFMNQFLMIFNMEENHVGIKSIKKTVLPVINITKDDFLINDNPLCGVFLQEKIENLSYKIGNGNCYNSIFFINNYCRVFSLEGM